MEENVIGDISSSIEKEIIESKNQFKKRLPEIVVTLCALLVDVVLLCFGCCDILTFSLIFFGAVWNFFMKGNKLFACVLAFVVCTIFALISIRLKMYGSAFLHICFYLPTQLIYFYENQKIEDVSIKYNKQLSKAGSVGAVVSMWLFTLSLAFVLYEVGEPFYIIDSVSVALLAFSVFLSNGEYREYWFARITACGVSMIVWLYVAFTTSLTNGSLVIALLFLMYTVMDTIHYLAWRNHKDLKVEEIEE